MRFGIVLKNSGQKIIQVLSGRSNVFLLINGNNIALIDTGPGFMRRTLQARLDKSGIDHIDCLILTHTHFDHAANAKYLKDKYHLKVLVHEKEREFLERGENVRLKGTKAYSKFLINHFGEWFLSKANYKPCQADIELSDYYDLAKEGFNTNIIYTPGHTLGSCSIIVDNEIALVGDAMIGVIKNSILPPFANDLYLLAQSWEKLLGTSCRLFLSGHGWVIKRQEVENGYHILREKLDKE